MQINITIPPAAIKAALAIKSRPKKVKKTLSWRASRSPSCVSVDAYDLAAMIAIVDRYRAEALAKVELAEAKLDKRSHS